MAAHADNNLAQGDVRIGAPTAEFQSLLTATVCCDQNASDWFRRAEITENIYYFAIYWRGIPVGQILLHDINWVRVRASSVITCLNHAIVGAG